MADLSPEVQDKLITFCNRIFADVDRDKASLSRWLLSHVNTITDLTINDDNLVRHLSTYMVSDANYWVDVESLYDNKVAGAGAQVLKAVLEHRMQLVSIILFKKLPEE